jgi:hypothetical protein
MLTKIMRSKDKLHVRGTRERAHGQVVCLTAYVPPELALKARIHAAKGGDSVSSLVAAALSQHLGV